MRVAVIYGSESGTAERGIRTIAKGWKESKGIDVSSIMEGADAARIGLASLAEQYDFLAVATSSNGEGDPPFNFHPFLKALYEADDAGDKPLTGCGFAVLGFGCSHFDTFQNCPRLTDKLLGQLGASRRVKRAEVDEIEEEAGDASKKTWADAVAQVIKSGKAVAANVCEWTQPGDTILDKHDEMLVAAATGGPPPVLFIGAALAVVAAVYFVKFA